MLKSVLKSGFFRILGICFLLVMFGCAFCWAAEAAPLAWTELDPDTIEFKMPSAGEKSQQRNGRPPSCTEPATGIVLQAPFSTGSQDAPVPLFFTADTCSLSGNRQYYAIENPAIPWDGTGGQILTFKNCCTLDQQVTISVDRQSCPGGLPYGILIVVYQDSLNPWNPSPFNSENPCENNLNQSQQPGEPLWFAEDLGTWRVQPGYYQVLMQTNLVGGTCSEGVEYTIQLEPSGCSYTSAPIPAISHGGMVIFILLLAGSAVWILRRKRQGQEIS